MKEKSLERDLRDLHRFDISKSTPSGGHALANGSKEKSSPSLLVPCEHNGLNVCSCCCCVSVASDAAAPLHDPPQATQKPVPCD